MKSIQESYLERAQRNGKVASPDPTTGILTRFTDLPLFKQIVSEIQYVVPWNLHEILKSL